jgi:hypothetical protein
MAEIKRQCVVKQGSLLDAWDQLSQEPCYMIADLTSGDVRLLFSLEIAPVMGTRCVMCVNVLNANNASLD